MKMHKKNKTGLLGGIFFGCMLMAVVTVFAVKNSWFDIQKANKPVAEKWIALNIDAWPELNAMLTTLSQSFPFVLNGKAILKNNRDSIMETTDFSIGYFDQSSFRYRIDKIELLQTKKWQAWIDKEKKFIAVNTVSQTGNNPFISRLDIAALKKIFSDGRYTWQVMQNDRGQRLLVSDEFSTDGFSGLQIRYDIATHNLISVNMGMPKSEESNPDTLQNEKLPGDMGIKLNTESLELVYEPLRPMRSDYLRQHPDSICSIKQNKITIRDKELQKFSVINNIK